MTQFTSAFASPVGSPIRELFPYLSRPGMISFAGGYPSPALFDQAGIADAAMRALSTGGQVLQYGPTEGSPRLRDALAALSGRRGISVGSDQLLVTTGSQQAFDLLVRVLVSPGDHVLVESPAYPAAIQALRLAGAALTEVPMDADGVQMQALKSLLDGWTAGSHPRLMYTVPSFSNPRGSLMPLARRTQLVELAHRHGFLVVEDDPYGELSFGGDVPSTLFSIGASLYGDQNPVAYLSSLSKTVAPALRVGWLVADAAITRRCAIAKQTVDLCTSPVTQLVAAEYLESGRYAPTVAGARYEYARRLATMSDALVNELGDSIAFDRPVGGMFLWAQCRADVEPRRLFEAAVDESVLFVPGEAFHLGRPRRTSLRLSFANAGIQDILEGVGRLGRAFRKAVATG